MTLDRDRLRAAYRAARDRLLAERNADGFWVGELSSSALSTATAVAALAMAGRAPDLVHAGVRWIAEHQNGDGGWGDTVRSFSNISTTVLCRAAFHITGTADAHPGTLARCDEWLTQYGDTPEALAEAVRARYGPDRTFSVPILTMCALAGLVAWREVPRLPFELACLPQSWYRFAQLPVVSYALPALIAIGQCVERHRGGWNPLRKLARRPSLRVLRRIQPASGGYLEAAPLTSFVTMSLASIGHKDHAVANEGVRFLVEGVRPDGSWPIDSNLSIWLTTLSVNALSSAGDLASLPDPAKTRDWLAAQQLLSRHPYTGAGPGGWGWSHLSGSVPDCDDTPGALLATHALTGAVSPAGVKWLLSLQNGDGGWPTFCRGWGKLPFDRSGSDLTAHALRALAVAGRGRSSAARRGLEYLRKQQRADGSWLPLWFGNQHADDDINPVYGTARVLAAYRDLGLSPSDEARRGVAFLSASQNHDGGWGGAAGTPSSVEETSLAVEALLDLASGRRDAIDRGSGWLVKRVESGGLDAATPIGFYFAKLWYFERQYPVIFATAALGRALRQ